MFDHLIRECSHFIRLHIQEITLSITAVVLMLAGPLINGFVKHVSKNFHWFLRYLLYILLCTIGYGALTQIIYKGLRLWLIGLANPFLVAATVFIFMALAWFAKQQKEI